MSIQNQESFISYDGNGSTIVGYTVPFKFFRKEHLRVTISTPAADTVLVLDSGYSVTGEGDEEGGQIFTTIAYDSNFKVIIERAIPLTNPYSYTPGNRFPEKTVEQNFDWLVMAIQDLANRQSRFLQFPTSEPTGNKTEVSPPDIRKGTVLAFNDITGEFVELPIPDLALKVLATYGLSISSQDVLAAISAIAPIIRYIPPTIDTSGKPGQLAIIPAHNDIVISGTLTPDITGQLEAWKTGGEEIQKLWYSSGGVDPETRTDEAVSITVTWTNIWVISVYAFGVLDVTKRWIGLNGQASATPDACTSWINVGTTGQPGITLTDLVAARVWFNASPEGALPDWIDLADSATTDILVERVDELDRNTSNFVWPENGYVCYEGDSWTDQGTKWMETIEADPSYRGTRVKIGTVGHTLANIQADFASGLYGFRPSNTGVPLTVFIQIGTNDLLTGALSMANLETWWTAFSSYCTGVHNMVPNHYVQWKIPPSTLYALDAERARQIVNARMESVEGVWTHLIDVDQIVGDPWNLVEYESDGVHLKDAGRVKLGKAIVSALKNGTKPAKQQGVVSARGLAISEKGIRRFYTEEYVGNFPNYVEFIGSSAGSQGLRFYNGTDPWFEMGTDANTSGKFYIDKIFGGAPGSRRMMDFDIFNNIRFNPNIDCKITTGRQTFADNAAALAGGLTAGMDYKTATGEVRTVV